MNKLKITSTFQLVFFTVIGFTLLSGGISLWLASSDRLSPQQNRFFETCNTTWNMGIGAIFGLLGSKATDLLDSEEDNKEEDDE